MLELEERNDDLRAVCSDLRALRLVVQAVEGNPDYSVERETLAVVRRAMEAVIGDVQEVIGAFDEELKKGREG